jgi:hypothetical protein
MQPKLPNGTTPHQPAPGILAQKSPLATHQSDVLRYGDMFWSVELFDRAAAEATLANAAPNRNISNVRIKEMAAQMIEGRWMVTASAIIFNKKGQLIDGEHRIRAVIEADVVVPMLVMRNADDELRAVIDTNRPRSVADLLRIVGGHEHSTKLSSALRMFAWLFDGSCSKTWMPFLRANELVDRHGESLTWAILAAEGHRHINNGPVIGALAFAYPTNREGLEEFARKLGVGARLDEDEPAMVMRNSLLHFDAARNTAAYRYDTALRVLRAAQAQLEGQKLENIRAAEGSRLFFLRAHKQH